MHFAGLQRSGIHFHNVSEEESKNYDSRSHEKKNLIKMNGKYFPPLKMNRKTFSLKIYGPKEKARGTRN